ncbi:MAG: membrane-bound serine protease (ClpP class) [Alcanivorax sp.]|jgi:membrane-bound serine protease (ClpP class)|uniref:NfeD family protein n=1 Tax=Alcanivorax sp. TaxID=1872427 RepID=UPI0039E38E50
MGREYQSTPHHGHRLAARVFLCVLLALLFLLAPASPAQNSPSPAPSPASASVWVMTLDGPIGPALSDWFVRSLEEANKASATLFVLQLNTPGGLDSAMRDMIRGILDSRVPVATYVSPSGSRAASAGTYILYASHIAAMAPATNLGAATPVQIGGGGGLPSPSSPDDESENEESAAASPDSASALHRKRVNDAVAYIRGLAELRDRNADWAEKAVREAVSLSSSDALAKGVIDLKATDLNDLLAQLDGQALSWGDQAVSLALADAQLHQVERDWRTDFLAIVTDPSIAYLLLLVGIYGLVLEFSNPGMGVPGVLGAICLLLALYALQMLPVSYVGLGLILLGAVLVALEAISPSFGVLGIGGVIAFVIGSIMLMDTDLPAFRIALPVIAAVGVGSLLLVGLFVRLAVKAHEGPPVTGAGTLVGQTAVALDDFEDDGQVRVLGEIWHARSQQPVRRGQLLQVTDRSDLMLDVKPDDKEETS